MDNNQPIANPEAQSAPPPPVPAPPISQTLPSPTPPVPQAPPLPQAPVPQPGNPLAANELNVTSSPGRPRVFLILIILILVIGAAGAGLIFLQSQNQSQQAESSPTPEASEKKNDEMAGFVGIPIGPNTVQVTKTEGKYCLRYKGKIYLPEQPGVYDPQEVTPPDPEVYTWYGLVEPPSDLLASEIGKDEMFSFKSFRESEGFSFIMRWPKANLDHYELFYFRQNALSPIASFQVQPQELAYRIPKIAFISPEGESAALSMFDCWECERHYPQTLLVNFASKQTKLIGPTSFFEWKEDGNFEYKEYQEDVNPDDLPLKTDRFAF